MFPDPGFAFCDPPFLFNKFCYMVRDGDRGEMGMQAATRLWFYKGYALDSPSRAFGEMDTFVSTWQKKMGERAGIPLRTDFDFFDFQKYWGRVSIADFCHDPFDVRFRLWGTTLTEWWGMDYTNRYISQEKDAAETWERAEKPYFKQIAAGNCIGAFSGSLEVFNRDHIRVKGVELPLIRDGKIAQVITVYQREGKQGVQMPTLPPLFSYE